MTTRKHVFPAMVLFAVGLGASPVQAQTARWSEQKAQAWYAQQPWLIGSNYVPASAINQLEMWQEASFDPGEIDRELGWAEAIGMNTMRVFLHDLLWQQDAAGFRKRIDQFLAIASRHRIRPMLVLFDSCWDPFPRLGPQHPPTPGVHNSGWVQGPGAVALTDSSQYPRLKAYVQGNDDGPNQRWPVVTFQKLVSVEAQISNAISGTDALGKEPGGQALATLSKLGVGEGIVT